MKRLWVRIGIAMLVIVMTAGGVSAYWWSQSSSFQQSSYWNPWGGGSFMQQSSSQTIASGGGMPGYFGGLYSDYFSSYQRSSFFTSFAANGTQIADVSGVWKTDLLGNLTIRLTGDDIIRASYQVNDKDGYMQGNFSSNGSPVMDGFWWQAPEYRPPYQAGAVQITFENSTALSGVYAYSDGTWGPFNGIKIRANLTSEEDAALQDMPKLDWTVDEKQTSDKLVSNPVDTNPITET
ncbi:MAG: hypothetical protein LUQ50_14075 [Methanospirillum sp.]|uniref:hypothetical protein n=1 Tax=Methanospirillum sp. TaxID=45200 RepID=UPI00236DB0E8|nr:hypothetical protein [Methanospirillum sp.]MDD1730183.1 hypothetical protein [Methanospirillum sp.]